MECKVESATKEHLYEVQILLRHWEVKILDNGKSRKTKKTDYGEKRLNNFDQREIR